MAKFRILVHTRRLQVPIASRARNVECRALLTQSVDGVLPCTNVTIGNTIDKVNTIACMHYVIATNVSECVLINGFTGDLSYTVYGFTGDLSCNGGVSMLAS